MGGGIKTTGKNPLVSQDIVVGFRGIDEEGKKESVKEKHKGRAVKRKKQLKEKNGVVNRDAAGNSLSVRVRVYVCACTCVTVRGE